MAWVTCPRPTVVWRSHEDGSSISSRSLVEVLTGFTYSKVIDARLFLRHALLLWKQVIQALIGETIYQYTNIPAYSVPRAIYMTNVRIFG